MKSKKLENRNTQFNKDILNYLDDKLSSKDKYAFEKNILDDDFDFEALEGLEDLDTNDIIEDEQELRGLLLKKSAKRKITFYYRLSGIAAAVGILIIVGSIFLISDFKHEKELISQEIQPTEKKAASEKTEIHEISEGETQELIQDEAEKKIKLPEKKLGVTNTRTLIKEDNEAEREETLDAELPDAPDESIVMKEQGLAEPLSAIPSARVTEERKNIQARQLQKQISPYSVLEVNSDKEDSDIIITGRVFESGTKEPLPGVNLYMDEARLGTMTDMDGNFQIEVPAKNIGKTLKVNYIGYLTEEIPIQEDTSLEIALVEDILALDEIVVVGYGTKKKRDLTGSVSVVEMNDDETFVKEEAQPVIGFSEFKKYLRENIVVPESLQEGESEKVKVKITVHKDGKIRRVEVLSSPGEEFSKEAIRLILEGPEWKPKTVNGKAESADVTLRIRFRR